ncbi:MAG: hypothetical protein KAI25_07775 [Hyphomicrobiaceae bacterium]|nr:hypothetical protein [Hyphomicrobiaceae bacterium]
MGKKSKGPKGPQGAAAYVANVERRGLTTVVDDTRKKVAKKRRSYKRANTPVSDARS